MGYCYPDEVENWISEELDRLVGGWTFEDYEKVVEELPETVSREDVRQIVARVFPNGGKN